jgi:cytochrome c-type biogenesis protein CcmH
MSARPSAQRVPGARPGCKSSASRILGATVVVMLATLALMATSDGLVRAAAVTEQEIAEGLTCQCGCGLTVANCNHPSCSFSVPMRQKIDGMLARGLGRAEVIAYFRAQYGEKILSAPTTRGFNLIAWIVPFAALLAGGGIVAIVMGRWRGATRGAPAQPSSSRPFDPALRERLERKLRERI